MAKPTKKTILIGIIAILVLSMAGGGFLYWHQAKGKIRHFLDSKSEEKKKAADTAQIDPKITKGFQLEVTLIKPNSANTPNVQQVTITFNKPMVPLGDFEKLAQGLPVKIEPEIPCNWRWLNRISLACQLDKSLPGSNKHTVTIAAGFPAYDGTILENEKQDTFSTEQWRVVRNRLDWQGPDLPLIYLAFNQPMELKTLRKHINSDCGKPQVKPISKEAAKQFSLQDTRSYEVYYTKKIGLAKKCNLTISEKAQSQEGPEEGQTYNYEFVTYPEFYISRAGCGTLCPRQFEIVEPTKGQIESSGCDPDAGVNICFSTPMYSGDLANKLTVDPFFGWKKGNYNSPDYLEQYPKRLRSSHGLNGPMLPSSTHTVTFAPMKDRFGRPLKYAKKVVINTIDFRTRFNLTGGYGVLEKNGPLKLAYGVVNVPKFYIEYLHSNKAKDIQEWYPPNKRRWDECRNYDEIELKKTTIDTGAELNISHSLPFDLQKISPDYTHGLFAFRASNFQRIGNGVHLLNEPPGIRCKYLVVTDLGILAKIGFFSSGIWVHSIQTGKPVPGVKVGFRDYKKVYAKGVTDKRGSISLEGAIDWDPERDLFRDWDKPLFAFAETGEDLAVLPFEIGSKGIEPNKFNNYRAGVYFSSRSLKKSQNHVVHAIADRPLYQPGQEVKIKIFSRHWEPKNFGFKPNLDIKVLVDDAMGKNVFSEDIKLSEFGTAHIAFKLGAGVPLGSYRIRAEIGTWTGIAGNFDVQEFVLPSFKVEVEPEKKEYKVGDSVVFNTKALYHFGGGVGNTDGEYIATYRESRWSPSKNKWKKFTFDNPTSLMLKGYAKTRKRRTFQLKTDSMKTSKNGEVNTPVLLPVDQIKSYGTLTFESKFKDDRGKTLADTDSVKVYYTDSQLGIRTPHWTYETTQKIIPELILIDENEELIANVLVKLTLANRQYKSVRVRGTGNYFSYQTTTKDQIIDECQFNSAETAKGCDLQPKAAGSYFILAESKDKKGRSVQSSLDLYVTGPEYVGWYRKDHDRIELVPDKKEYNLGDTVQVLVKNPYEEVDALFTIERFGILKKFRKKLTQSAAIVEIPLDDKAFTPGFNLSVQLIKGRVSEKIENEVDLGKPSFKMGRTKIKVNNPDTLLAIKANTDRPEYEPQNEVTVSLDVKSPSGSNLTELSIAVVDERILQLAGNYQGRYDLHSKFYQIPDLDVITSQMLNYLIGRRHFGKKGAPSGGDGGIAVRKDFLPIAYWNPSLKTDESGKASIKFKTPDNLTTWRVLVTGVDKAHRFGYGDTTFITTKKVLLEPALPSFLTEGDKLNARVTVFNRTGKNSQIKGNLDLKGAKLESKPDLTVNVDDNDKAYLEWKISAPVESKKATLTVKAQAEKDGDAAQYFIPIRPYTSFETFATYGSTTKGKVEEPLKIPAGIRSNLGGIEVVVSPSLISHLDDVFRYAFEYPYECWEQKMVKALMLSNYINLNDYLNISDLEKDPEKWIQELLAEMPKFQYGNGAMAYWKPHHGTIDPYLSVFTALGLFWLNQSKVAIPEYPYEKLLGYVRGLISGKYSFPGYYTPRSKATVLAMAVYVTTILGDDTVSDINKVYEDKKLLSLFGKSFLWMASNRRAETKEIANTLKNEIYSTADMTSGDIQFQEALDDGFIRILHSTTRTNCTILTAMLEDDPEGQFVQPLVRWIIGTRKANRWNNTQENLYCLQSITNYSRIYEKEEPNFTVSGEVLEASLKPLTYKGYKGAPETQKFKFSEKWVDKKSSVILKKKGEGRLYYTARMRIAYKDVRKDPVNSGMRIGRAYFLKDAQGKWIKQTTKVKTKRGDLVKIQLKIKIPATRYQVAINDNLPGGLEPLNTALAGTSSSDAKDQGHNTAGSYWWNEDDLWFGFYRNGGFYHREARLHGMQYFANFIEAGEYELNYIAQAIATGSFQVNPSYIEQMYAPEVYGKSRPAHFWINE